MNKECEFKEGQWVYAEKSPGDHRPPKFIPIFQIEEISIQNSLDGKVSCLRPIKRQVCGVNSEFCRLATPEEIIKAGGQVELNYSVF